MPLGRCGVLLVEGYTNHVGTVPSSCLQWMLYPPSGGEAREQQAAMNKAFQPSPSPAVMVCFRVYEGGTVPNMVKDVALPYMLDGRHSADMVFQVCEADHRFYQRDERPVEDN